jgi:murein DD-endopeptidase MepM/ murein hydrolase activator NlpD
MKRRRHRFFRGDLIAPWATMAVMLGIWWLGASMLRSAASDDGGPARVVFDARRAGSASARADRAVSRPGSGAAPSRPDPAMSTMAGADPAPAMSGADAVVSSEVSELRSRALVVPVAGVQATSLRSTFTEARSGGRTHEAMDILAPRGTGVLAAVDGQIVKLFTSALGGLTIYQFDAEERFCYYYAHLDGYAPDLTEGQRVVRGQTIGYVGTTGNAPPGTPHLHFAIYKLGAEKRWWDGVAIDPYLVLR